MVGCTSSPVLRIRLHDHGVTLIGGETTFIDETVEVGSDTVILPHCVITGATTIGTGCQIGPHAVLHNATIGDRVQLRSSTVTDSSIAEAATVGPYAHIRGNSHVGARTHDDHCQPIPFRQQDRGKLASGENGHQDLKQDHRRGKDPARINQ